MINIPSITSADFLPLAPALILVVAGTLLLLSEVFLSSASRAYQSIFATTAAVLAMVVAIGTAALDPRTVFLGFAVQDPFSSLVTAIICFTTALAALNSTSFLHHRRAERGEYYGLMLFAAAGMSLLAISAELITLFINLEVMSISTYALTAYLRRGARPSEAAFKYFILGAFSSAILLYGVALLYGATGSTQLSSIVFQMGPAFRQSPTLVQAAVLLIGAGFAFKVAAVPFHMWTPDVYEGAPTPVTGLMSAGVKAAAFAIMVRVLVAFAPGLSWQPLVMPLALLALLTMVVGNLLAIPQRNVKRMLAYSSIAHAGYVLVAVAAVFVNQPATGPGLNFLGVSTMAGQGLAAGRVEALKSILFYLLSYAVSAVGAFACVSALERRDDDDRGTAWDLDRFSGLAQRRPGWAVAMAAFMLSLGGIPPTVGFMGKLYVFRAAVDAGLVGLAIVGVLASAAGVYYYLRVVVYMFMRPAPEGGVLHERHWGTEATLVLTTAAVVLFGILPGPISEWLTRGGMLLTH